jgi:hypothetical protein
MASDSPAKKLAIFVLCHKGGVGKTTWCRGYLDIARSLGLRVAAYDADGENGQLLQYYGTRGADGRIEPFQYPLVGVLGFDIRHKGERDTLVNASETDADIVLFDLPGGSVHELSEVLGDDQLVFATYRAAGYTPVVVMVIDQVLAAVRTVSQAIDTFGDSAEYVVVMNTAKAQPDEFIVYNGFEDATGTFRYGKGRQALLEHGGEEIAMPGLNGATYAKLDLDSISFSGAALNKSLYPADRLRVVAWLEKFRKTLSGTIVDPEVIVPRPKAKVSA